MSESSPVIEFQNMVFERGLLNVTVRQGPKWAFAALMPGQPINIQETDNPKNKIEAIYNGCMLVSALQIEQSPGVLLLEHDPACRNYTGLAAELARVYGEEPRPYDLLSVVLFTPLGAG